MRRTRQNQGISTWSAFSGNFRSANSSIESTQLERHRNSKSLCPSHTHLSRPCHEFRNAPGIYVASCYSYADHVILSRKVLNLYLPASCLPLSGTHARTHGGGRRRRHFKCVQFRRPPARRGSQCQQYHDGASLDERGLQPLGQC
jgi:hypothetical protein